MAASVQRTREQALHARRPLGYLASVGRPLHFRCSENAIFAAARVQCHTRVVNVCAGDRSGH